MASIIIVDDEEIARHLLCMLLENAGHTVSEAGSVAEARVLLEVEQADVVITDIYMKAATGIDLLAWVQEQYPRLPVILLTGGPTVDTTADAIHLGAFDTLIKPVDPDELLGLVDRAVQLSKYYVTDNPNF